MAERLPCKMSLRIETCLCCQEAIWHFKNCQQASFAIMPSCAHTHGHITVQPQLGSGKPCPSTQRGGTPTVLQANRCPQYSFKDNI